MLERFTDAARRVVILAQEESTRQRHAHIGTEHLLVGLLAEPEGVAGRVLRAAGLTVDGVRGDVSRLLGDRPLSVEDAAALRAIGIDLDQVRAALEASFGPGALAPGAACRPRRRGRWRPCPDRGTLTPRAKKALELSLRESLRLGHGSIDTEHLLLGLLREGEGLAVRILVEHGIVVDDLRTDVLSALGRVA